MAMHKKNGKPMNGGMKKNGMKNGKNGKMQNKMNVHKQKTIINFHTFGRN